MLDTVLLLFINVGIGYSKCILHSLVVTITVLARLKKRCHFPFKAANTRLYFKKEISRIRLPPF